jgi:hypothetical protein
MSISAPRSSSRPAVAGRGDRAERGGRGVLATAAHPPPSGACHRGGHFGPDPMARDLSPPARGERKSVPAARSLLPHPEAPARSAGLEGCLLQRSARSSFEARHKSAEHLRMRSIVLAAHRLRPSLSHHHQATKRSGRSVESVSCPKRLFSTRFRQKREAERREAHCPTNVRVKRGGASSPF